MFSFAPASRCSVHDARVFPSRSRSPSPSPPSCHPGASLGAYSTTRQELPTQRAVYPEAVTLPKRKRCASESDTMFPPLRQKRLCVGPRLHAVSDSFPPPVDHSVRSKKDTTPVELPLPGPVVGGLQSVSAEASSTSSDDYGANSSIQSPGLFDLHPRKHRGLYTHKFGPLICTTVPTMEASGTTDLCDLWSTSTMPSQCEDLDDFLRTLLSPTLATTILPADGTTADTYLRGLSHQDWDSSPGSLSPASANTHSPASSPSSTPPCPSTPLQTSSLHDGTFPFCRFDLKIPSLDFDTLFSPDMLPSPTCSSLVTHPTISQSSVQVPLEAFVDSSASLDDHLELSSMLSDLDPSTWLRPFTSSLFEPSHDLDNCLTSFSTPSF